MQVKTLKLSKSLCMVLCCVLCFAMFAFAPKEAKAASGGRNWYWPVPSSDSLSSCYGDGRNHWAIDIAAPIGSVVIAPYSGTVKTVSKCGHTGKCPTYTCNNRCGNYVEIEHTYNGTRYLTRYLHLNTIGVSVGENIIAGQQIGTSGQTGEAYGPHLHFQMRNLSTGLNVDPLGEQFLQMPRNLNANGATTQCCYTYVNNIRHSYSYYNPQGYIDVIDSGPGTVTVKGWTFDLDAPTSPVTVHVYVGGDFRNPNAIGYNIGEANQSRGDVASAFSSYGVGSKHGFGTIIYTTKRGVQPVYIYAIGIGPGDTVCLGSGTVDIPEPEHIAPEISNVKITDLSSKGYTVSCTAKDASGIDRVQFPTWTLSEGQDDLFQNWDTNTQASGQKSGDTYTYRVNISDHNNEKGSYRTHIYAYDKYGNSTVYRIEPDTTVPAEDIIKGDLQRKGKPTLVSFTMLGHYLLKWRTLDDYQMKAADMNDDGKVTIIDFTLLGNTLLNAN